MILIYTKYITDNKYEITYINFKPENLSDDEKSKGIFVDNIPDPEFKENQMFNIYYNPTTKEIWYEYYQV